MVCSSRVREKEWINAADGDKRTSLLLRSSTSTKRQRLEAAQSFMRKRASQRDKNLGESSREQGATVTAPRFQRLQFLPAFSGLVVGRIGCS
jgi:hypothetical protein